ncbi:MAG: PAS domain S-box protein [Bacteroidota bacterium]
MKDSNNKIIRDISLLYELSLAFGESLSIEENCSHFIKVLMARKGLTYGAVWLREDQLDKTAEPQVKLTHGNPAREVKDVCLGMGSLIWKRLETETHFMVTTNDPDFVHYSQEATLDSGCFLFYRLKDIGFLKLHSYDCTDFEPVRVNQLVSVIRKFALFLNGCMAHEREKRETQERIKIQEALFQSEEKYRTVVQSLTEGIVITDLDGKVTFVNERMLELTGFEKEELLGGIAYKLLVPESEQGQVEPKFEKRSEGQSDEYFVEHLHKSGRRWMARIKGSPYRNGKGEIIGTMGVVNDISAQREVERKIVESEQKLRKIINTSLDAVITIDEEGKVTEWSSQAEQTFGYTREEALHQSMSTLIVPEAYRQGHDTGMKHFLRTGEGPVLNSRIEITGLNKEGREFPIELSVSPMKIGGKYLFSAFIRDITERKKAEEELIAAKQAAEQAQHAEQQFLTNMSHEIRTPMNAVIGMTHLLYETKPNESQKEYLDSLLFSADSLMGIINNILDLSKIEAGELEFEKRMFNLQELMKGLQQTFQFKVRDKAVSVVMEIDPKIENHLLGDAVRLNQILTNLLGNASKFTSKGTIGIKAKLMVDSHQQYIIQFQVHDTGIGIDQKSLGLIFQNFKQADIDITRKFGGTGLGLAIVKQLVELQGGSIEVNSEKGKGSVFSVVLPFENAQVKLSEVEIREVPAKAENALLKSRSILVVEDNFMNQKLIRKIMDLWDCQYEIAGNGLEALERSKDKKFDLILMDIHMPEMDGCETTVAIRKDSSHANHESPIIALTAAALLDEKNRALESGMNDFLTKPFSPKQLHKMIVKWIGMETPKSLSELPARMGQAEVLKVDLTYLRDMSKGDDTFIREMIDIFIKDVPGAVVQMQKAMEVEDWILVGDIAHRIKSNYMMLGMGVQQNTALKIERDVKQKKIDPDGIGKMIYQLKTDTKLVEPLLEKELGALTVP